VPAKESNVYFDPVYFLFLGPGLLLSLWASWRTKSAFSKWSKVRTSRGITGAQAAQMLLDQAGIRDVKVVPTSGFLSDHYNPMTKTLALSEPVYGSASVAAIGVACHEAGHAIQHAQHYAPLWVRSLLVPTAKIGSTLGYLGMAIGLGLQSQGLVGIGAVLFGCVLAFQVVTLPVEFDASARAKKLAFEHGIVSQGERPGVSAVLNAAAMTYVAAAVSTLLTLLYFLLRSGLLGGRRD
jgi:Zn-dependent membrane protease YugP